MDNYICINGKKAELTEEQLKALGIELPKSNPFERVCSNANEFYSFYYISSTGSVCECVDSGFSNGNGTIDLRHRAANYCTDKAILEQRALHETLNRLLWRYSMEHGGDKIDWNDPHCPAKYYILFDHANKKWDVSYTFMDIMYCVYFATEAVAEAAIEAIVNPFMNAHPEFKF